MAIFLSLNVMMFTMALWTPEMHDARAVDAGKLAASLADLLRYACLILSLPVLWLLGMPLVESALAARRRDVAATDLLIVLGVVAAYVYSAISVVRGFGHVYFEVGCAVLVTVTIGRWLEASGKLRTTAALDALQKLLPRHVAVLDSQGRIQQKPVDDVAPGDLLRVLPGERIATDGEVATGCACVSEQFLTGESRPITKHPGDRVLGGALNLDGELVIRATARVSEGSLARLVELVQAARLSKGRYQRLADRVSSWFLRGVLLVSAGTFAFHTLRSGVDAALMASLAVLLIACPCALGLATPLAIWTALGTAARHGVLFRHGESLERLASIRAIRFDKTGTLTTGDPRVAEIFVAADTSRSQLLHRVLRLAAGSTHVYSQAIARKFNCEPFDEHAALASPCESVAGHGVSCRWPHETEPTRLGSLRWLEACGLQIDNKLRAQAESARRAGQSLSAIGWDRQVRGLFVFAEALRTDAARALSDCAALGLDVAVLTGDEPLRARQLVAALRVPVSGGMLPEGKVAALGEVRRAIGPVAMVGDGVNDAPALAASDVGLALGCGADLSRESAAVCLMSNDLARVSWSISLARQTVRVMRQNLFWAFSYNTVGVGMAAVGWLNPAWAAAAMAISSLLVVGNSLRLRERADVPSVPHAPGPHTSQADLCESIDPLVHPAPEPIPAGTP
jgi:heavy metal translocating P-type ATPase